MPSKTAKVIAMIEDVIGKKFYGSLVIKFQNGRPTHVEKKETFKIDAENPRKGQSNAETSAD